MSLQKTCIFFTAIILIFAPLAHAASENKEKLELQKVIHGKIAPKSIVHSGSGLFFAQNMMYGHSITVYNRNYQLVKTVQDQINFTAFGHPVYSGVYSGAPVEATFTHNGRYAWISNYQMYGDGFNSPGSDDCNPSRTYDNSFVYRLNTEDFKIESVIEVGCVPKYIASSPDNRLVLVSNWCSSDVSIIDVEKNKEATRIKLGLYPRGIAISPDSRRAYVALMGANKIAVIDLNTFHVSWLPDVGISPRHLCLSPNGRFLFASLNGENKIVKLDLQKGKIISKTYSGASPRSMVLSLDGKMLYVVNYHNATVSKIRTSDLHVIETVSTKPKPIGITVDPEKGELWVSCYSGSIMIFRDNSLPVQQQDEPVLLASANNQIILPSYKTILPFAIPGPVSLAALFAPEKEPEYEIIAETEAEPEKLSLYAIVAGSFNSLENAEKIYTKLIEKQYPAQIVQLPRGMYTVIYNRYSDKNKAQQDARQIQESVNGQAWVLTMNKHTLLIR